MEENRVENLMDHVEKEMVGLGNEIVSEAKKQEAKKAAIQMIEECSEFTLIARRDEGKAGHFGIVNFSQPFTLIIFYRQFKTALQKNLPKELLEVLKDF